MYATGNVQNALLAVVQIISYPLGEYWQSCTDLAHVQNENSSREYVQLSNGFCQLSVMVFGHSPDRSKVDST